MTFSAAVLCLAVTGFAGLALGVYWQRVRSRHALHLRLPVHVMRFADATESAGAGMPPTAPLTWPLDFGESSPVFSSDAAPDWLHSSLDGAGAPDPAPLVNPATGWLMCGPVDMAGNAYGFNSSAADLGWHALDVGTSSEISPSPSTHFD